MNPPVPIPNSFTNANNRIDGDSLRWLMRMRWVALTGQILTIILVTTIIPIDLWIPGLIGCLLLTAGSNLWLQQRITKPVESASRIIFLLLMLDVITLTAMLYWSGGVHNPFTSFYLLHITVAAVLLPRSRIVFLSCLAITGFAVLYVSADQPCHDMPMSSGISQQVHIQGMVVAFILTGLCIALFVGRLQADLHTHAAALTESRLRLAQSEHFASLATLAAGVAHELATPLGTIAIASRELERQTCLQGKDSSCKEDARLIRTEIDRCRAIIDRLGNSEAHAVHETAIPVRASALCEQLPSLLPPAQRDRLTVTVRKDWVIEIPERELLQSLVTLIKNACEADLGGKPVSLLVYERAGYAALEVKDVGTGMDASTLARAGEPFFTTKPAGQGMGLGLFLVRMFASRHGGNLELISQPGKGTCAILLLPLLSST